MSTQLDSEEVIPPEEVQLIHTRREEFPSIKRFLWKWVRPGLSRPVLGQNALVDALSCEESEKDILELEEALKDGASACADFNRIFEGRLPQDSHAADTKIRGALAEVEGYRYLRKSGFERIRKTRTGKQKAIDFTAEKMGLVFGVEVICLGTPISNRKKVEPEERRNIKIRGSEEVFTIEVFSSSTVDTSTGISNEGKVRETIRSAILEKLPQLKSFNRAQNTRRVFLISTGIGFAPSIFRQDSQVLPQTWGKALHCAWAALPEGVRREIDGVVLLNARNEWIAPEGFEKLFMA